MHRPDSYEIRRRARILRARLMGLALRRLAQASGRWWRRLGAVGLRAGRALLLAG
jgi:hypothetical protein